MPEPKIPQKSPCVLKEENDPAYWCSCGQSSNQPYCDGSHSGTDFQPMEVKGKKGEQLAYCCCKHSNNKPFCDGSHSKL